MNTSCSLAKPAVLVSTTKVVTLCLHSLLFPVYPLASFPSPHLSPPLVSSWHLKDKWLSLPCCGYQSSSATNPSSEGLDRDLGTNAGSMTCKLFVLGQIS